MSEQIKTEENLETQKGPDVPIDKIDENLEKELDQLFEELKKEAGGFEKEAGESRIKAEQGGATEEEKQQIENLGEKANQEILAVVDGFGSEVNAITSTETAAKPQAFEVVGNTLDVGEIDVPPEAVTVTTPENPINSQPENSAAGGFEKTKVTRIEKIPSAPVDSRGEEKKEDKPKEISKTKVLVAEASKIIGRNENDAEKKPATEKYGSEFEPERERGYFDFIRRWFDPTGIKGLEKKMNKATVSLATISKKIENGEAQAEKIDSELKLAIERTNNVYRDRSLDEDSRREMLERYRKQELKLYKQKSEIGASLLENRENQKLISDQLEANKIYREKIVESIVRKNEERLAPLNAQREIIDGEINDFQVQLNKHQAYINGVERQKDEFAGILTPKDIKALDKKIRQAEKSIKKLKKSLSRRVVDLGGVDEDIFKIKEESRKFQKVGSSPAEESIILEDMKPENIRGGGFDNDLKWVVSNDGGYEVSEKNAGVENKMEGAFEVKEKENVGNIIEKPTGTVEKSEAVPKIKKPVSRITPNPIADYEVQETSDTITQQPEVSDIPEFNEVSTPSESVKFGEKKEKKRVYNKRAELIKLGFEKDFINQYMRLYDRKKWDKQAEAKIRQMNRTVKEKKSKIEQETKNER